MKPCRILLPGGIIWLMSCLLFTLPQLSYGQCTGTVQSVTYSTPLSGTGSDSYTPSLQQYNPPPGYSLISATIDSYITATASVNYHNTSNGVLSFFPVYAHNDLLSLNGNDFGPPTSSNFGYPKVILQPMGSPGDTKFVPTQTVLNHVKAFEYVVDDTDPVALADYQGAGNLTFAYQTTSFLNFAATTANGVMTIADNITFSITYSFCNPTLLATHILSFTAIRESDPTIRLDWVSSNEEAGDKYELQSSMGGSDFASFATVNAKLINNDASYTYPYPVPAGAKGKLYFRLKSVNADGSSSYSGIRIIDLGDRTGPGFSIYPNPPTDGFVNLVFGSANAGWQVELVSANGSLLQRESYHNTPTARLNFHHQLAAGAYFVRAMDVSAGKSYVRSFVIR